MHKKGHGYEDDLDAHEKPRRVASAKAKKVAADKTIVTKTRLKDGTYHENRYTSMGPRRGKADILHHRGPPMALSSQVKRARKKP